MEKPTRPPILRAPDHGICRYRVLREENGRFYPQFRKRLFFWKPFYEGDKVRCYSSEGEAVNFIEKYRIEIKGEKEVVWKSN